MTRHREQVLTAAVEILTTEGLDALTQATVARRSGVSRATVYRLWPDRVQLVLDALRLRVAMAHSMPRGVDLRADVAAEALSLARQVDGPLRLVVAALIERAQHDPALATALARLERQGTSLLRRLLREAHREGRLAPRFDVELATTFVVGAILHHQLVLGRRSTRTLANRLAAALITPTP